MKKCLQSDLAIAHLTSALSLLDKVGAAVTAAHVDAALGSAETELGPMRRRRVESDKLAGAEDGTCDQQRVLRGSYH